MLQCCYNGKIHYLTIHCLLAFFISAALSSCFQSYLWRPLLSNLAQQTLSCHLFISTPSVSYLPVCLSVCLSACLSVCLSSVLSFSYIYLYDGLGSASVLGNCLGLSGFLAPSVCASYRVSQFVPLCG